MGLTVEYINAIIDMSHMRVKFFGGNMTNSGLDGISLGERIAQRIEDLNLEVSDVSEVSGLTTGHIYTILNGKRANPQLSTLVALSKALRVTLDFFYPVSTQSEDAALQR